MGRGRRLRHLIAVGGSPLTTGLPKSTMGAQFIEDETAENGYAYGGDPVPIDTEQIWNLPDNPKASDYPEGSQERRGVDRFNQMYWEACYVPCSRASTVNRIRYSHRRFN